MQPPHCHSPAAPPPVPAPALLPLLQEMVVQGVPTTAPFHMLILDNESFKKGDVDTGFIPKHAESLKVSALWITVAAAHSHTPVVITTSMECGV